MDDLRGVEGERGRRQLAPARRLDEQQRASRDAADPEPAIVPGVGVPLVARPL
jgi:hypothetical protein